MTPARVDRATVGPGMRSRQPPEVSGQAHPVQDRLGLIRTAPPPPRIEPSRVPRLNECPHLREGDDRTTGVTRVLEP